MANYVNDIIEVNKKKNNKGPFIELKIRKENGEIVEKIVYGEACNDFTVPGRYEVETEKRKTQAGHDFWAITAARLIGPGAPEVRGSENGAASNQSGAQHSWADIYRNDAYTAQVAIKAAADITVAAIAKATQPVTATTAKEYVCSITEGLIVSSTVAHEKKDDGNSGPDGGEFA